MSDKDLAALARRVSTTLSLRAQRIERQSVDALTYSFILDGAPVDDMSEEKAREKAREKLRDLMRENGFKESA